MGIETSRGVRIGKDKTSKKIDAIVALAMACVAAVDGSMPFRFMPDPNAGETQ